jgi:hypothetical protein
MERYARAQPAVPRRTVTTQQCLYRIWLGLGSAATACGFAACSASIEDVTAEHASYVANASRRTVGGIGLDEEPPLPHEADVETTFRDGADGSSNESCVLAKLLWSEDFETGDYQRWTSQTYGGGWGNHCQQNGFSEDHAVSGTRSHRSEITCAYEEGGDVHRGYGGIQFDGDHPMEKYTNDGVGIDAPFGVVNTYWSWLETPTIFSDGRWFSFFTVDNNCAWQDHVLTLGLEDETMRLAAAHHWWNGGSREILPDAPSFPMGRWVRTTIYLNYYEGVMHVWQDGQEVQRVNFIRETPEICQFHWGVYASADNDDIVLYEDDISIWKLEEPWTDFSKEPWLGAQVAVCDG